MEIVLVINETRTRNARVTHCKNQDLFELYCIL